MALSAEKVPRICLLAAAETSPSVLYGLLDVLGSVGAIYPEITASGNGVPAFDVKVVAAQKSPFRCYGNVVVEPDLHTGEVTQTDIVIVCDIYQPVDSPPRGRYRVETAWLRRMHAQGAVIASVCSGALMLAESGLLDGLEAACHWGYRDMFREHYPAVKLREDLVLCLSSPDQRIVTTGAVFSWQELALYLISRFCGPDEAIRTAKIYLFAQHTDGQLPFIVTTPRAQKSDALINDSQMWVAENYATSHPVAQMTARTGLSSRTFARRFRAATGYHPMDYVHTIRVEEAKQLLETTDSHVDEIAETVGYEDASSFRRLFKRKAGLTPAAYRRKFAGLVSRAGPAGHTLPDRIGTG